MKKYLIIFILSSFSLFGQEQLPIYNQYLFGSYFLINPAVAGIDNVWKVQAVHRQQWVGLKGAPSTRSIALEGGLLDNFNGGGYVFMDENGYSQHYGFNLSVSYIMKLDEEKHGLRRLSLGVSYTGSQRNIDHSSFVVGIDPAFNTGRYNYYNHNSDIGAFLIWDGFYAGISGAHMLSGGYTPDEYENSFFPRNYNILVGQKIKLSREFYIEPSSMLRIIENYDTHVDFNAKLYYISPSHRESISYWLGLSQRTSVKEWSPKSLSVALLFGGNYERLYYGYSYEIMTDEYQMNHSGSHQLMVGYTLSLVSDRKCGCTPFSLPVL